MKTTDKAKAELERLVKLFEDGEAPQAIAKVVLTCPDMPSSKWTLSNRLLAFAQTLQVDCRGFRQWRHVNRKVKKGARAAYILRPLLIKKKVEEDIDKADRAEPEEREIVVGFGCVPVFALSQTEGDPLPELAPESPPALRNVAETLGIHVDYQAFGGSYYGFYSSSEKQIILCTHEEQVFFHELAHGAHERVLGGNLKHGQNPKQEIVAELSACVLARLFGRKDANEGAAYEYIKRYAEKLKKSLGEAVMSILCDVEKVLTLIISTSEKEQGALAA